MAADTLSTLATIVGSRLKAAGHLLVTAESCTGGWVGQAATAIAGSSDWYERGFVTYSNAAKQELLGVREGTIERYGAVSEETAREMAAGALKNSRATLAVAVTGIAGPSGGSAAKPVGTVCIAWALGGTVHVETCRFDGDRERVRRQSVIRALQGVIELLDEGVRQV